jgi:hypothetical protein
LLGQGKEEEPGLVVDQDTAARLLLHGVPRKIGNEKRLRYNSPLDLPCLGVCDPQPIIVHE